MLRTLSTRSLTPPSSSLLSHLTRSAGARSMAHMNQPTTSSLASAHAQSPLRLSQIQSHLSQASPSAQQGMSFSSSAKTSSSAQASSSGRNGGGGGDDGSESKVLTSNNGSSTTILLNRPKALNAIDTEMVHLIGQGIDAAPKENHIILRGKGRALCSGGDVLAVVNAANSEDATTRQEALTFFKDEFELDYKIATLNTRSQSPQVFISVMDGITMGGGVGLSVSAPIRIATEKTMFAMPETGIGYWPDVGVTRNLARLDGKIGVYLGMTGARITGEEAYLAGLATHFIPSSSIDEALRRLSVLPRGSKADKLADTLDEFALDPFDATAHEKANEILSKSAFVGVRRVVLDYVFGLPSVEQIFASLEEISQGGKVNESTKVGQALAALGVADFSNEGVAEWASSTLKTLKTKSPRSLKVSYGAVLRARQYDVNEAFLADMRLATAFCDFNVGRDFYEGVTFTLTKDPATGKRREGIAKWSPATIEEVDDKVVEKVFFGSLEDAKEQGLVMQVPTLQGVKWPSASSAKGASTRGIGPLGWEREYNTLALPSEAECEALREGSHPSAGNYALSDDEIVSILRNANKDKPSLDFKVREWLQRRRLTLNEKEK